MKTHYSERRVGGVPRVAVALSAVLIGVIEASVAHASPEVTLGAGVAVSSKNIPNAEVQAQVHFEDVSVGALVQAGRVVEPVVGGFAAEEGFIIKARLPIVIGLWTSQPIGFNMTLAPGLRYLGSSDRNALAVTADTGFTVRIPIANAATIDTGLLLPVGLDVSPEVTLARFPGLTLSLGTEIGLSDEVSLRLATFLSAPEGYGGDGDKSIVEGFLGFSYRFGAPSPGVPTRTPYLSGSI
jgi:hypothetical protein